MPSEGAAPRAAVTVSNARAEASRRNGAKSRGPNTEKGKARAAQNALRHGLRAQKYLVLPEEDGAEFAALEAALLEELAPVGALQTVLEAEVLEFRSYAGANAGLALIRDGNGTRSFETLLRYRGAAMAEFWRALKTLKALQAEQAEQARHAEQVLKTAEVVGPNAALAAQPIRPPARPALADRAQPNEPERGSACAPEPRLEFLLPDRPAPGALPEPAALWTPNEPESDVDRCGARPNRLPSPPLR
jgi:hypothetical protein